MTEPASGRRRFPGLSPRAYEHPSDRAALSALRSVPGFDLMLRKMFRNVGDRALRLAFLASAVRVGPRQLPQLYEGHAEACAVLDIDVVPELFVAQTPFVSAGAVGVDAPFVVLDSAALHLFGADELQFVLAHELSHVRSGHALYKTMLQLLLRTTWPAASFALSGAAILGITAALLEWDRCSQLSADRAGLLVVQSEDVAERVILKLAGGSGPFDADEVIRQAAEYGAGGAVADSVLKLLRWMGQAPPFPVLRLAELRSWTRSGAYQAILEGAYATRHEDVPATALARPRFAATQAALMTAARGVGVRAQSLGRSVLGALRSTKPAAKPAARARRRGPATKSAPRRKKRT
jgi:Zn-dependent protease with chaperone function